MVEPHEVHVGEQCFQPVDTPTIAGATQGVPVIHRVAPQLAGGAEIIGRDAGDETRAQMIELETLRVGPNITRVL